MATTQGAVDLNDAVVQSYVPSRIFDTVPNQPANSLDFTVKGDRCAISFDGGQIILYDVNGATSLKEVHEYEFGTRLLRFTHHETSVLICGKVQVLNPRFDPFAIRYLSLHDNRYLQEFGGHSAPVVSLCTGGTNPQFLSGASNGEARLWDLRSARGVAKVKLEQECCVALDPDSAVFALASGSDIRLYDTREYEKGPFEVFQPTYNSSSSSTERTRVVDLQFTPDGKHILTTTATGSVYVLDSFDGQVQKEFKCTSSSSDSMELPRMRPACSQNSNYVACCNYSDINVHSFNEGSEMVASWNQHSKPVQVCGWSPVNEVFVSACQDAVVMWLPR